MALKTEALGLAVAAELPLVVVNSQRAGPSTGMPTKTEQSDLYQAVYGRNADTPLPVIASRSPGDCFDTAIEAVRIALRHMTPVILLTDGYIANASELWPLPDFDSYLPIPNARPDPDAKGPKVQSVFLHAIQRPRPVSGQHRATLTTSIVLAVSRRTSTLAISPMNRTTISR